MTKPLRHDATSPLRRASPSGHDLESLRPIVAAVLRRVIGANDPEYEDVFQNSLERLFETLERNTFKGACPLPVWAAIIAKKAAIDSLRKRYREREVFGPGDPEDAPASASSEVSPERAAQARERLERYAIALSQLSGQVAKVVYLHDVLGYELVEVASMTSISVAAAQSRLVRGRHEIVQRLGSNRAQSRG